MAHLTAETIFSSWMRLISVLVEVATRRSRGELPETSTLDAALSAADEQSTSTRGANGPLIGQLPVRLSLSLQEELVVWCLVARQLDPHAAAQLEALSGGTDTTFGALLAVAYAQSASRALAELTPNGRLFRFGLVERTDDPRAAEPAWASRTVRATDRLLALALGASDEDADSISDCHSRALVKASVRAIGEVAASEEVRTQVQRAFGAGRAMVLVSGVPGLGRRTLLAATARDLGIELIQVDARKLAKDPSAMAKQLRAIARECKLLARTPLLANIDALVDEKENRLELVGAELLPLIDGLVLATCGAQRPPMRWDRPVIAIEMGQPTSAQRATLWRAALGQGSDEDAELLAGQYPLAPALIHHAAEAARARAAGRPLVPEDIYGGIRSVLDDRLGQLAKRVTVSQTWDDLVLPTEQTDTIIELMARVRERRRVYEQWGFAAKVGKGLGVSALFSGPPGTGKTMVAALIARDLGLELYQVDLSKVVSKWIGETEKNLAGLFDAAEAGHAILLFDEADALFGKRTDVKSSNDRHANLETNYLLQRLESFTGICLLTSNHESNIDPAFQRRLSLHLRFELPDVDERAQLWRAMLPATAPVAPELDFAALARRYAMSGGYIRNAALRAAFLAADEGSEITAAHLERAARVEYEGLGKIAA
jgi:hypothetical protein